MAGRPLPDELPLSPDRGATWWRVLGIGIAVLGATMGLNVWAERRLSRVGPNWSHRLVEAKFALVEAESSPVDWLVLGDSSAAHGVRPDTWTETTGDSVLNLATVAGLGVVGDAWQLQDYLARVGPPGAVVLVHTADVWGRSTSPALVGQVPRPLSELWTLAPRPVWSLGDHRAHLLSRFLPLYAESGSLVSSLFGHSVAPELRFSMDRLGHVRSRPADADAQAEDRRVFEHALAATEPVVSDDTRAALATIDDTCAAAGVRLFVVHAPVWSEVALTPAYRVHLDTVDQVLSDTLPHLARAPLRTADGVPAPDLEATVDHLLPAAAGRFTATLARALTPSAGASGPAGATPL